MVIGIIAVFDTNPTDDWFHYH